MPTPDTTDDDGNDVYIPKTGGGAGFFIVVEAKPGGSLREPGSSLSPPLDLQIEANKNLGLGTTLICDSGSFGPGITPTPGGGVPGVPTPSFEPTPFISDALADFTCRFSDTTTSPCTIVNEIPGLYRSESTKQFCTTLPVRDEMHFPTGDTLLTMRWRDVAGNFSNTQRFVIRVQ